MSPLGSKSVKTDERICIENVFKMREEVRLRLKYRLHSKEVKGCRDADLHDVSMAKSSQEIRLAERSMCRLCADQRSGHETQSMGLPAKQKKWKCRRENSSILEKQEAKGGVEALN